MRAKMEELKRVYDEKLDQKEDLRRKADYTEMMLERAAKLVEGLAEERVRWEKTVEVTHQSLTCQGEEKIYENGNLILVKARKKLY